MAKNFTQKDSMQIQTKSTGYNLKKIRTSPVNVSPSEATIRNLLNYSKALSAIPDRLTGNFTLILLN
ncbi:MAG: hypothetical protein H6541_12875 [Lentimicrobiaceae bacterium]|nr:hypothetical protein [Lentimicrobiaceae bacterium]MCB9024281.1 hypothetical protein [Lentimicrobiaceae bacterium]MCO5264754.1 hypothetical protein [Lentimicrobium sp.]HPG32751.1 hypothetical protein [Lentimicrobium sp.]